MVAFLIVHDSNHASNFMSIQKNYIYKMLMSLVKACVNPDLDHHQISFSTSSIDRCSFFYSHFLHHERETFFLKANAAKRDLFSQSRLQ